MFTMLYYRELEFCEACARKKKIFVALFWIIVVFFGNFLVRLKDFIIEC